jgi:anti-sigma factor RsiW
MNCFECQQRLQDRLDGAAPGDMAAVQPHLAQCPACRELFAAARLLERGLRLRTPPAPPRELGDRIVHQVLAHRRSVRHRRRVLIAVTGLAASLLAVVLLAAWRSPKGEVVQAPSPNPVAEPAPSAPVVASSLREDVAEATSAVAALTRRTAEETVEQGRLLLPTVRLPEADEAALMGPLEPPVQSLSEAGQGVYASLAPVRTSARRALGLFLRDLPPGAAEDR